MGDFWDCSKTLTINRLNFIDMYLCPKTSLKGPERACKRATVASQLWPFQLSSVALSQARRARKGKSPGFSDALKPVLRSGREFLSEVFLLILFATIRHLTELPFHRRQMKNHLCFRRDVPKLKWLLPKVTNCNC